MAVVSWSAAMEILARVMPDLDSWSDRRVAAINLGAAMAQVELERLERGEQP
jgi:hypothetical protein